MRFAIGIAVVIALVLGGGIALRETETSGAAIVPSYINWYCETPTNAGLAKKNKGSLTLSEFDDTVLSKFRGDCKLEMLLVDDQEFHHTVLVDGNQVPIYKVVVTVHQNGRNEQRTVFTEMPIPDRPKHVS